MVSKRQLIETFGEERDGKTVVVCPHCDNITFESLEAWKDHMQELHGGYTVDEVSEGIGASSSSEGRSPVHLEGDAPRDKGAQDGQPAPPTTKPKKLSAKARELNDKANRCIAIILKHFISGMNPEEQTELENNRRDLTEAFVGIEFNFEERLFTLEGKWAIILVLVLLYAAPILPNLKTIGEKVKERTAKAREKK